MSDITTPKTNQEKFHYYLSDLESPDIFIDWNFYFLISSCLSRKVWLGIDFPIFPNIYVVFVAKPGFGKSVPMVRTAKMLKMLTDLGKNTPLVNIAPDTISFEKMIKRLEAAERETPLLSGHKPDYRHCSISFTITEMGTLFRDSNPNVGDLTSLLCQGWDADRYEQDTIKHGPIKIENVCICFAGCCVQEWFGRKNGVCLTEGWNARTIYIFGEKKRKLTTFFFPELDPKKGRCLIELNTHLRRLGQMPAAPIDIDKSKDALAWITDWYEKKEETHVTNNHKSLEHYYGRKKMHLIKLAIIMHFAEKLTYQIDVEDCEKALEALNLAEKGMHLAFAGTKSENPLFDLAENIKGYLRRKKDKSESYLNLLEKFFDEGDDEMLMKALDYLKTTKQVEPFCDKETNQNCLRLIITN